MLLVFHISYIFILTLGYSFKTWSKMYIELFLSYFSIVVTNTITKAIYKRRGQGSRWFNSVIIMSGNIAAGTQGTGVMAKSLHLIHRRKTERERYLESHGLVIAQTPPLAPPSSGTHTSSVVPCFPTLPKQLYQQKTKHLNIAQED